MSCWPLVSIYLLCCVTAVRRIYPPGPCENGGVWRPENYCVCRDGFEGEYCQFRHCTNGAEREGAMCLCQPGYSGELCEISYCKNGRFSAATNSCICGNDYSGRFCQFPECGPYGRWHREEQGNYICNCIEGRLGPFCRDVPYVEEDKSYQMIAIPVIVLLVLIIIFAVWFKCLRKGANQPDYAPAPDQEWQDAFCGLAF